MSIQKEIINVENNIKTKKKVILTTDDKVRIPINHYNSSKRNIALIICPSCDLNKDTSILESLSEEFFEFIDVITMNFRGHSKKTRKFTFTGKEVKDLKAVITYAKSKYSKVLVLGFSLGASITLDYASKNRDIDGIIVVNVTTDTDDIAADLCRRELDYPYTRKYELIRRVSVKSNSILIERVISIYVTRQNPVIPTLFINAGKKPESHIWYIEEIKRYDSTRYIENEYQAENIYLKSPNKFMKTCKSWIKKKIFNDVLLLT